GQCLALRPDIIVIFAGNNWRPHLSDLDIPHAENLLRVAGVPGLKSYLDENTDHAVRLLVAEVNSILDPRGVKLVWVVPEFNLADWTDPPSTAPLLPGRGNREWRDLNERCQAALRAREFELADKLALQMTALDGGTNAVPLRILAE